MSEATPRVPTGPVFIDVDHDRGALVLTSIRERAGLEVEIEPIDQPNGRTHVCVLPRSTSAGVVYAAVFPSLLAGRYRVLDPNGCASDEVTVRAGKVATARWE